MHVRILSFHLFPFHKRVPGGTNTQGYTKIHVKSLYVAKTVYNYSQYLTLERAMQHWAHTLTKGQKTTKLRRNEPAAQAAGQTLPDATPPVGKIHPHSKIPVTVEPIKQFRCPSRFRISEKCQ